MKCSRTTTLSTSRPVFFLGSVGLVEVQWALLELHKEKTCSSSPLVLSESYSGLFALSNVKDISTIGVLMQTELSQFFGTKSVGKMIAAVSVIKSSHWTVKRSQLERGHRLHCTTLVRRGPRVTTTWRPPVSCLTSTASLHEDDAKSVERRGEFGWCFVLGTRVIVLGDTRERCVHTSFPLGFLLTRVESGCDRRWPNQLWPSSSDRRWPATFDNLNEQTLDTCFGGRLWPGPWPILGSRRLKQNVGKGRPGKRRREGTRQTRKRGSGTIKIVHVLCGGVAGRRRRLHTRHGLCPPLGFQRTFMSSIAGVWSFGLQVLGA